MGDIDGRDRSNMNGYNPFARFSREYVKEILKAGRLNGSPLSSKQRYHLQRRLKDTSKGTYVPKVLCKHPKKSIMMTSFNQKYCRKCGKNI